MILGPISYFDCAIFVLLLIPQLIYHVGLIRTSAWLIWNLPFIFVYVVLGLVYQRFLIHGSFQPLFVRKATLFQDLVVRCVRYAFAYLPAEIGQIFFSEEVTRPFLAYRMMRHGYWNSPLAWRELDSDGFKSFMIAVDHSQPPDIVVFYCHGGGFSMGSSYFYMEFLLAWVNLLVRSGYMNPALISVDYTLVPEASYPTQWQQVFTTYLHCLDVAQDSSRVCVAGDSAGATLILTMLLRMSDCPFWKQRQPGYCVMMSPWPTLISPKNRNTSSDYLDRAQLHHYALEYLGSTQYSNDIEASPGLCKDPGRWASVSPSKGWFFTFGSEEVLAPETRDLISVIQASGVDVDVEEDVGGIHCWPVASLYLADSIPDRLDGLSRIVRSMRMHMGDVPMTARRNRRRQRHVTA